MISAVNNVSFRGEAQDLINAPGRFSSQPAAIPNDTVELSTKQPEEKKSKSGLVAGLVTLGVALAAFAGLGYAVKSGKLNKIESAEMPEGFFNKAWAHTKNVGHSIGEFAAKCYDSTLGKWFGGKAEKAAEEVAETAAETAEKA